MKGMIKSVRYHNRCQKSRDDHSHIFCQRERKKTSQNAKQIKPFQFLRIITNQHIGHKYCKHRVHINTVVDITEKNNRKKYHNRDCRNQVKASFPRNAANHDKRVQHGGLISDVNHFL